MAGGKGGSIVGGAGGTGYTGKAGAAASRDFGGGGGGGGAGGGAGGAGGKYSGTYGVGGGGGIPSHPDGYAGAAGSTSGLGGGGGGGGGGLNGYVGAGTGTGTGSLADANASFSGGAGGAGGGGYSNGLGGGGGAGGYGAIASGPNIQIAASIHGGTGGAGGAPGSQATSGGQGGAYGGQGGDGGTGFVATAAGAMVTTQSGSSALAGSGGSAGLNSSGGAGGVGIAFTATAGGANLSNAGTAAGGGGGSGATALVADGGAGGAGVTFAGDNATLTNQSTGIITGGAGGSSSSTPGGAGAGGVTFAASGNLTNAGTITGGSGGSGGAGGIGGNGGAGVAFTGAGSTVTNQSTGTITGGQGGSASLGADAGSGAGIAFAQSGTLTNAGTITGGAGVNANSLINGTKGGAGVYGGQITIVNTGTISGGAGGSAAGQVDRSAGPTGDAITFTGGANYLALGTNAQFNGALDIQGGTLTFDQGKGAGLPDDVTVEDTIAGGGIVVKAGLGTLTLSGANTYTGGTSISSGTLAVASDGNLGNTTGNTIGGVTLAGGTLETTATGFTSARAVTLIGTGTVQVDGAGTATLSGAIGEPTVNGIPISGSLTKTGAGTLTLTAADTYTGGTTISAGMLQLGDGTTNGSVIGSITDNSVLVLDPNGSQIFANTISGTGALSKIGTGTAVLSSANAYSGGTTISAGTLSVSADANLGATSGGLTFAGGTLETTASLSSGRTVSLGADGTVQIDTGTTTLSGVVSGSGALDKSGAGTLTLSGANTYSGGTEVDAGTLSISADGNLGATSGGVTLAGGTLETTANITSARGVTLDGAGTVQVDSGISTTLSGIIGNGASTGFLFKSGAGTLTLAGANTYSGGTEIDAGTLAVSSDGDLGTSGGLTFGGGTLETTVTLSSGRNITLGQNGVVQVDAGTGTAPNVTTLSGRISGGAGLVKTGAGTLTLSGAGNTYSGDTTITGGTLDLAAASSATTGFGPAGTGAISFQAATNGGATELDLETSAQNIGGTFGNVLDSFGVGDTLDLKGFAFGAGTKVTYTAAAPGSGNDSLLTVSNGNQTESFNLTNETPGAGGLYYAHQDASGTGTRIDNVVCFASGTLIRTLRGDVAVETLKVCDLAVTASGAARPIKWIGKRSFDCGTHPTPAMVRPIRVAAGAFGAGRPYRDLTLSPHHAVAVTCVDEVLIPIRLLVNGSNVSQIADAGEVTYWHVELDSHDILVANGLPAESYVDVGNRCDFDGQETLALHPLFEARAPDLALAAYCRPLVTGGAVLAAIRSQLAALAAGDAVEPAAKLATGFHLLVDGTPVAPVVKDHQAAFVVAAGAKDLRIVSPTWSPRDGDRSCPDDRRLGVMIEALSIGDVLGTFHDVPLDHSALVAGFHPIERSATGRWRWTDGDALLGVSLWAGCAGPFVLRLTGQFDQDQANLAKAARAA